MARTDTPIMRMDILMARDTTTRERTIPITISMGTMVIPIMRMDIPMARDITTRVRIIPMSISMDMVDMETGGRDTEIRRRKERSYPTHSFRTLGLTSCASTPPPTSPA